MATLLLIFQVSLSSADAPPSYTETDPRAESDTEYQSYLDRLKEDFAGMSIGILLVCVSFPFLFWNEGRAVVRSAVLDVGSNTVVSLLEPQQLPENDNNLVALHGLNPRRACYVTAGYRSSRSCQASPA